MLLTVIITHTSVENKSRFHHFYFVLGNGQCFNVDSKEVLIKNDGNAVEECCVNTRAMEYAIHICSLSMDINSFSCYAYTLNCFGYCAEITKGCAIFFGYSLPGLALGCLSSF